ncbi:MAG: DUF1343 domain-containing protein [Candidatus Kapabacteria bacterium]|nr:DUF1343 domain-containing protein [Ignavibacteriota bacterium]MCW5884987.1 DUF1343 domain-containing protein [Candidatus Kapabacteria bacterium]
MYSFTKIFALIFVILSSFLSVNLQSQVKNGIDVLESNNFAELSGMKVFLFTNSTGRASDGRLTAEILATSDDVDLIGILTPEHGFFTSVPAGVKVDNDNLFGVPVYSLYSDIKKPGNSLLAKCDAIVADIQDIGVRSYTYISSLFRVLQAAAENGKPVYVLDRPNPLGGNNIDGNVLEAGMESFVGIARIPYIHGLTIGELATMFNGEGWLSDNSEIPLKCELNIIKMSGYKRSMVWEDTGLMWYPTSPNVPTVNTARGLAMLGIFGELGIISIGIGTTTPFQLIGSLDFDWSEVKSNIDFSDFYGIHITETRYNPQFAMHNGKTVKGVFFNFYKNKDFKPYSAGFRLMLGIRSVYPDLFNPANVKSNSKSMFCKVTGTNDIYNALFNNVPDDNIVQIISRGLDDFKILRAKYLLYE